MIIDPNNNVLSILEYNDIERHVSEVIATGNAIDRKDRINIFVCDGCKGHVVTRDVDLGFAPAFSHCGSCTTPKQAVLMRTCGYPIIDQTMREDAQWHRPSYSAYIRMHPKQREYINQGGLVMRPYQSPLTVVKG